MCLVLYQGRKQASRSVRLWGRKLNTDQGATQMAQILNAFLLDHFSWKLESSANKNIFPSLSTYLSCRQFFNIAYSFEPNKRSQRDIALPAPNSQTVLHIPPFNTIYISEKDWKTLKLNPANRRKLIILVLKLLLFIMIIIFHCGKEMVAFNMCDQWPSVQLFQWHKLRQDLLLLSLLL